MISYVAIIILNIIALIAILVARSELRVALSENANALREIDKLSSALASDRAEREEALASSSSLSHRLTVGTCSE